MGVEVHVAYVKELVPDTQGAQPVAGQEQTPACREDILRWIVGCDCVLPLGDKWECRHVLMLSSLTTPARAHKAKPAPAFMPVVYP